jgi:hypothetical protein
MDKETYKYLRYATIIGNILFMSWIISNGIDEGFKATPMQAVSYITLITLLILNSVIIYRGK